jgi:hypothetical protein
MGTTNTAPRGGTVEAESLAFQVGYHRQRAEMAERDLARALAEVSRLRAMIFDEVSILEIADLGIPAVDGAIERLADGRYRASPVMALRPCDCGDGSCMLCDDRGMVAA